MYVDLWTHVLEMGITTHYIYRQPIEVWICLLMMHKSESFEIFKRFWNEIEKQTEKSIKTLWSDREGEYLCSKFLTYLEENEILSQWIPPKIPQHNGILERRNRILLDMVWSLMGFATLSIFFWGYALETVCLVLNNISNKSVSKTSYKIWSGRRPNL